MSFIKNVHVKTVNPVFNNIIFVYDICILCFIFDRVCILSLSPICIYTYIKISNNLTINFTKTILVATLICSDDNARAKEYFNGHH